MRDFATVNIADSSKFLIFGGFVEQFINLYYE